MYNPMLEEAYIINSYFELLNILECDEYRIFIYIYNYR